MASRVVPAIAGNGKRDVEQNLQDKSELLDSFKKKADVLSSSSSDSFKKKGNSRSFSSHSKTVENVLEEIENAARSHSARKMKKKKLERGFIDSKVYLGVIYTAIIVNSIQLGVQIDYSGHDTLYFWLDIVCNTVFVGELITKLAVLRNAYFLEGWNCFDCALVLMSVVDTALSADSGLGNIIALRALRMLRAVRIVRLMKVFKELWLIVLGIVNSLRSMTWVILLLLMVLYMAAILTTMMMRESSGLYPANTSLEDVESSYLADFNPTEKFGTILRSMHTLFHLAILSEFAEFGRPIFELQPLFFPFFLFFIIFVTWGVLNVLIAVIVEITMDASANLKEEEGHAEMRRKLALLDKLREFMFRLSSNQDGSITIKRLKQVFHEPELQDALMHMGLPVDIDPEELWALLDQDGNGMLTVGEFIRGAFRLVSCGQDHFQFQCLVLSSLASLKQSMQRLEEHTGCAKVTDSPPDSPRNSPKRKKSKDGSSNAGSASAGGSWLNGRSRSWGKQRSAGWMRRRDETARRLRGVVPKVDTHPTSVVSPECLANLMQDGLDGALPETTPAAEVKALLAPLGEDRDIVYGDLVDGCTRLQACRDDSYEAQCLILAIVRESHQEATATRRACNELLARSKDNLNGEGRKQGADACNDLLACSNVNVNGQKGTCASTQEPMPNFNPVACQTQPVPTSDPNASRERVVNGPDLAESREPVANAPTNSLQSSTLDDNLSATNAKVVPAVSADGTTLEGGPSFSTGALTPQRGAPDDASPPIPAEISV